MATLEEVAKIAGVSRSTVSRVVNNDPNVKQQTRQHVLKIVDQMNFRPNTAARRLAGGKTGIFGLVIPTGVSRLFTEPYFPILIQNISRTCNLNNKSLMLWLAEARIEQQMIDQVTGNSILDGVIVSSMRINDPIVNALIDSDMPFVLIGRHPTDPDIPYVDMDNLAGAKLVITHLLAKDRSKIGTITGNQNMTVSQDRLDGYRRSLEEMDLPVDENLIVEGRFTQEGGYHAMMSLIQHNVDAVFCQSDTMAIGALQAIKDAGLKVPEDIAVVGFDDAPFAPNTDPPLTTVRQPTDQLAEQAVKLLMHLVNGDPYDHTSEYVFAELIVRKSS